MLKAGSYNVTSIVGGSMDNAITRESVCRICADDIAPLIACADSFLAELKVKYAGIDDGIRISIKECDKSAECFDDESTAALAGLLSSFPAGIVKMSGEIKGPDMNGIHSPEEKLSISSAARTWDFLVRTLERL